MSNYAIVLASGMGERFGAKKTPKHLTPIYDVPVFIWTVEGLVRSKSFKHIILVCDQSSLVETQSVLAEFFKSMANTFFSFAIGGKERMDSFANGLIKLEELFKISPADNIALVDANRPLTTVEQIAELLSAASNYGCSCPSRPVINGVARVINGTIKSVPEKSEYHEFVTPEVISFELLNSFTNHDFKGLKSCVELALELSREVRPIQSYEINVKLTYPEDLAHIQGLIKKYCYSVPPKLKQ